MTMINLKLTIYLKWQLLIINLKPYIHSEMETDELVEYSIYII